MPERWTKIRQIDDNIYANRRRKKRTQDEIDLLKNKLKNYDEEYDYLRSHKTYLKNIQEADTEKKLIGIEIAFKQDMTLSCNDLGSLCRAAEDKRYSLRNNEETLKLKQILFFRTKAEMDAYHDMSRKPEDWTEAEIEQQRSRFCSVWQVIEEAELVDEYEAWKEANPNA